MPRQALVVGNWKMHGTRESIARLVQDVEQGCAKHEKISVAVLPPFVYLPQVASALSKRRVEYGAQNVAKFSEGAFTGEVSAAMLADFGCHYALVGHSERRTLFAEDDATIVTKYGLLLQYGMTPIFCVGETAAEYAAGKSKEVVIKQLDALLDSELGVASLSRGVVAYEPVWAIGTGLTATPEQAETMHAIIRTHVASRDKNCAETLRILYGGSVKANNAAALAAMPNIDGMLVGGAALNAAEFINIVSAVEQE